MTDKLTPAMRQYQEAKRANPEAVLFFRMGDFFEMFYEDAEKAAPLLDIALTSRQKGADGRPIPMCGVPHHSVDEYVGRLTDLGYKVAVCDQLEDPSQAKGLVARGVTRVETISTRLSADTRLAGQRRYLVALVEDPGQRDRYGLAFLEVSLGDLLLGDYPTFEAVQAELSVVEPVEYLIPENASNKLQDLAGLMRLYASRRPAEDFFGPKAQSDFAARYGTRSLADWRLDEHPASLAAAAGALVYAASVCGGELSHLAPPRLLWQEPYLALDGAALANLEIVKTLRGEREGSLLGLMDKTRTPLGARLLRQWLTRPLRAPEDIRGRQGAVEGLLRDGLAREELSVLLKKSSDLERALSRLVLNRGGPRDLAALRNTLMLLPEYARVLGAVSSARMARLADGLPDLSLLTKELERSLVDSPPLNPKDGGYIRRGVVAALDELLDLETGGKNRLASLEAREREHTGISSLKVGFNRIYGYYLEVTKTHLKSVPSAWIRKQTIAGGERYFTPELKEWEEKILSAGERRLALEEEILADLKRRVTSAASAIKKAALILAEADVLTALADCAEEFGWVRPELTEEDVIEIKGGRHPVVERFLPRGAPFVSNDILLSRQERLLIITGPNMAGKSTILRQTALIVLLNQAGSFVPAESARLSIRDRIFTRVGASDDLSRGRSTFMVEMSETAGILSLATPQSLVVLDEVGRGTSTYDGLSIAWAVAEHLHDLDGCGVPTLFATHYHELVELQQHKKRVRNYNVAVQTRGDNITFLRKLSPGGTSRSHGLAVAAIAGLPKRVIERAREVLEDLSEAHMIRIRPNVRQLSLFDLEEAEAKPAAEPAVLDLLAGLSQVNLEELTPLAALNLLNHFVEEAGHLTRKRNDRL